MKDAPDGFHLRTRMAGSRSPVDGRDGAEDEVHVDEIPFLETRGERLRADARDPHLLVRFVGELVVHIVGQLPVDADRLHPVQHRFSCSLEHDSYGRMTVTRVTSMRVCGVSPSTGAASILATTSIPETTRPNAVYW